MRVSLKAESTGKEDPLLEQITNSLVIAFVGAAVFKIVCYLYTMFASGGGGENSSL